MMLAEGGLSTPGGCEGLFPFPPFCLVDAVLRPPWRPLLNGTIAMVARLDWGQCLSLPFPLAEWVRLSSVVHSGEPQVTHSMDGTGVERMRLVKVRHMHEGRGGWGAERTYEGTTSRRMGEMLDVHFSCARHTSPTMTVSMGEA